MTRFNLIRNTAVPRNLLTWGKTTSALLFAAILIFCSLTIGCSSDKPNPVSSTVQIPTPAPVQTVASNTPAPVMKDEAKPTPKKVAVRKRPATVTYSDKTSGVQFEYPRKYALETGDGATSLAASSSLPMDFVQPGGVALAAVELPESSYANTDFSSGYFSVNVHKEISEQNCGKFSVPQPKTSDPNAEDAPVFMLGDMEMKAAEAVAGEGARQSDSKYFHFFQNGACYEFVLNVTTLSPATEGQMKHVDRDKVFNRLETILATVKINPVAAAEPATTAVEEKPALVNSDGSAMKQDSNAPGSQETEKSGTASKQTSDASVPTTATSPQ
ncbi:MAG TPA: hypothetical protein VFO39_18020 [Candidatus Sulfotelmatobacter sp.]|nr:hypothetical protein [Candidatus Sulfotelmatobacter sp.]